MRRRAAAVLLLGPIAAACGGAPPMADAHESPEALGRAVLAAVARRDARGLRALAVSEQEFRDHLWPALPAARPERNLPFSYVWGDLRQKSEHSLARTLAVHGGRRYDLLRVEHAGTATRYRRCTVRRRTILVVRSPSGGEERLRIVGSLLESEGTFKAVSYLVDD